MWTPAQEQNVTDILQTFIKTTHNVFNKLCVDTILRVRPRSPRQLTQFVSQRLLPEILEPPSYTTGH